MPFHFGNTLLEVRVNPNPNHLKAKTGGEVTRRNPASTFDTPSYNCSPVFHIPSPARETHEKITLVRQDKGTALGVYTISNKIFL